MRWSEAQLDGFALAALACEDTGARRAEHGLVSRVTQAVTATARELERAPGSERRAWVHRLLGQHVAGGVR